MVQSVDDVDLLKRTAAYWRSLLERFQQSIQTVPDSTTAFAADEATVPGVNGVYAQSIGLINNAFDALLAVGSLWDMDQFHVPADYVLLRSAFDNALHAIWLLSPDEAVTRMRRAWVSARTGPQKAATGATKAIRRNPTRASRDQLVAEARAAKATLNAIDAEFASVGVEFDSGLQAEVTSIAEGIESEPWYTLANNPDAGAVRLWFDLSGLAHGERAHIARLRTVEATVGHIRVSIPDRHKLSQAAGLITTFLEQALNLYYERSAFAGLTD